MTSDTILTRLGALVHDLSHTMYLGRRYGCRLRVEDMLLLAALLVLHAGDVIFELSSFGGAKTSNIRDRCLNKSARAILRAPKQIDNSTAV